MGDFNTPLSPFGQVVRQKMNREITDVITQIHLTDIYRIFHPNKNGYTFFSEPHGTFSIIDHILSNKTNLNKYQKLEYPLVFYGITMD